MGVQLARGVDTVTRRVIGLMLVELLLAGGGLWVIARQGPIVPTPSLVFLVAYTAAVVGLVLLPRIFVEFRRHASQLTLVDTAMLVGLFGLGPVLFVVVAMVGEVVAVLRRRPHVLKGLFNLSHMLGGLVAAATTFALFGRTDPHDPVAWLAGATAIAACATWDLLSTAAVLSIAEDQEVGDVVVQLLPPAVVNLVVSAMLGTAAVVLWVQTPMGPLLFAPVVGILLISTRGVSHQRAERLRLQQLYEASSGLAPLMALDEMLTMVATRGRELVTGASAICCTARSDGSWDGVVVDDHGSRAAAAETLTALLRTVADGQQGAMEVAEVDRARRAHLPGFASLVWAAQQAEPSGRTVLVVFRELPLDGQEHHLADILAAFVSHAATAVANVDLHAEVREALSHQVALNRHKSEFLAAVSHELRTPLAAMIGSVQTIRRQAGRLSDDDREQLTDISLSQGERLKSLIEDLLLVAAADHKKVEVARDRIDVAELLTELRAEMVPVVGERLVVHVTDDAGAAIGDHDKIRRIIINLVENGRKYAPTGPLEVSATRVRNRLSIAVADHGPGIDEQDRERVFERFTQLEQSSTRRQGGTGLGLYLCRELATLLDGSLTLTTAASGGACFTLSLPVAPLPSAGDTARAAQRLPSGMARSPFARPQPPAEPEELGVPVGIAMQRPADMNPGAAPRGDDSSLRPSVIAREGVRNG